MGSKLCLLAYGQTGSGKSYTMEGPPSIQKDPAFMMNNDQRGLIPRIMEYIWNSAQTYRSNGWDYRVSCSFLEIYNDKVFDLMSPLRKDKRSGTVTCKQVKMRGFTPQGFDTINIESTSQFLTCYSKATKRRRQSPTDQNATSSRSHMIVQIHLDRVRV